MSTNDPLSGAGGEFFKHVETATDPPSNFNNPAEHQVTNGTSFKHDGVPTDTPSGDPGSMVSGGQPHMNPGSTVEGGQPHMAPGSSVEGGQPHMDPGSMVEGGQPHMDPGSNVEGGQPHMDPGSNVEGGQPHMAPSTGASAGTWMKHQAVSTDALVGNADFVTGGTPTWVAPGPPDHSTGATAPGNPDRPFRGALIAGLILLLLLVGAGGVLALKQNIFGCQSSFQGPSTAAHMLASCDAGNTSGGQQSGLGANLPAVAATVTPTTAPTATATAVPRPSATPKPRPTATPRPQPPTPTIKITSPANNFTVTTTSGSSPSIPFRASATAGSGASSVTITWVDSVDGTLGTGTTLSHTLSSKHPMPCGATTKHVVTAKAKNNLGGTASKSITVYVQPFCHM